MPDRGPVRFGHVQVPPLVQVWDQDLVRLARDLPILISIPRLNFHSITVHHARDACNPSPSQRKEHRRLRHAPDRHGSRMRKCTDDASIAIFGSSDQPIGTCALRRW
jgi:hypothetical protein